ncbi:MAG: GNAT family N-acetyltransferase [Chitinophagaceae bacterium]|nr:GNAT family N-acetyltransferase [Chitinophagaceae bacterium]
MEKNTNTASQVTVRQAVASDAPLIAEMSRQTFYDSFAEQNTKEDMDKFMTEQFTHEALMKEVTEPGNIFLLAYTGDEPAGYVRLREKNNPPELGNHNAIEIARIYAVTTAIGKGVGSALMKACIDIAREKNKTMIWLGVWEHNQRAIDFYARWGFEKFATHVFMLGTDPQTDWLMKKELQPVK